MVGRTLFYDIVKAVTGGGDVLVLAVDYVKGTLVHDVVETLQQIMDDHLKAHDHVLYKKLKRELTLVTNFLKNLFKDHVHDSEECTRKWATHSISHGLGVPEETERPTHYCSMTTQDVINLVESRGLEEGKKRESKKKKVERLMRDDVANETASDVSEASFESGDNGGLERGDDGSLESGSDSTLGEGSSLKGMGDGESVNNSIDEGASILRERDEKLSALPSMTMQELHSFEAHAENRRAVDQEHCPNGDARLQELARRSLCACHCSRQTLVEDDCEFQHA